MVVVAVVVGGGAQVVIRSSCRKVVEGVGVVVVEVEVAIRSSSRTNSSRWTPVPPALTTTGGHTTVL